MTRKIAKKNQSQRIRRHRKTNPNIELMKKIEHIKERVPYIEPTGECKDENTGEVLFHFTEAQHVFRVYREQCDIEGLHYRAYADEHIQPKVIAVGSMPMLIATFCIEDIKTGARLIGWGSGMGRNADWSGNTAATRALKQFLLTTFEASWEDPENPALTREQQKQELKAEVLRELKASGILAQIEGISARIEMANHFTKQFQKGDSNVKSERTTDTDRNSFGRNSKEYRAAKKRHNRRSKQTSGQVQV